VERLCAFASASYLEPLWLRDPLANLLVDFAVAIRVEVTPMLVAKQVLMPQDVLVLGLAMD
jgi:hypothetical protein